MQIKNIFIILLIMFSLTAAQVRVAVGNFENVSDVIFLDGWSRSVPQLLQTELSRYNGMTLLERQKMEEIFKEHELALSGFVEDSTLVEQLGKLSGADIVLAGSINKIGGKYRIDVNLIRVNTTTVRVESAEATDKDHLKDMIDILANNIAYQITGSGKHKAAIKIKSFPTIWFLGSGLVFGGLTLWANDAYKTNLDKYNNNTELGKFDNYYDKANSANKLTGLMGGLAATAVLGGLYCWIRNLNGPEIRAKTAKEDQLKTSFYINPTGEKSFGIQINF